MPGNHHHNHHKKPHQSHPANNSASPHSGSSSSNNNNSKEGKSTFNYINNNNNYQQHNSMNHNNHVNQANNGFLNRTSNNHNNKMSAISNPSSSTQNYNRSSIPTASYALKTNNLRKKLESILRMRIEHHDLSFSITTNYKAIIDYLSQIKFDSKEKLKSFLLLKSKLDTKFDYYLVKNTIIPHLIVAMSIEAYEVNQNIQKSYEVPEKKSYILTSRPTRVDSKTEQAKLIELAPKLSSSGNAYFSLEFDSVSVITRIFYDLIKTSKKFFRLMNLKIMFEKNDFQNLDFTSLKKTLNSHKNLSPAHSAFMKLKGIRNDWAHFVNPTTIPPHIIRACFIFCREIYDHYLTITTPNTDANSYMKRKLYLHEGFGDDYKIWEAKSKILSRVVAQFCQKPEKKKQTALRVVEVLSNALKNDGAHQDSDKLCNEILLNLLPRSPYILKEIQQINEKETPREDIVFILLTNEFQSRIKKDEQYVKAFSGTNLTDQKFVSKSVFFKAVVSNMKDENDSRQLLFERAYHYFTLEKCLKNLKDQNFEEAIIQKFKQEKNINTPKEVYDMILKEINTQVSAFRKLWVSIAIAFSSCTNLEIPDAIKYLSWALKEMTMTKKFAVKNIIKPYQDLVIKYLDQFNDIMLENLIDSNDVTILKTVTIRVCLASLLKFFDISPQMAQMFIVAREQIKMMNPQILQQLEPEDYYILNADPQNVNRDLLLPVELTFSDLSKNERANISVEGCFAFSCYQEILDDSQNEVGEQ